jgi:hypothetical protein
MGTNGDVWVFKMVEELMGVGRMDNGFVIVCERANGRSERWDSMRHDELGDMGRFVPMK